MRLALHLTTALCLGSLLPGCVLDEPAEPEEIVDIVSTTNPIYHGSPATQLHHAAVVSLHQLTSTSVYVSPFCSGTLIAPDVVLTAGHCLDVGRRKVRTMEPSALAIYVGDDPSQDILDHLYFVSETKIHPQYDSRALVNDIALVRLSTNATEADPVPFLPASMGFTESDIGKTLNFAGFGVTHTGTSGVKLAVDLPLAALGCGVYGCPNGGDYDTQISYTQDDAGPCSGDSGGPAFLDRDGSPYVAGITSYGDSYCTIYGVSTRTDAFTAWIDDFVGNPPPDCSADGYCNELCTDDPDCGTPPPPSGDCGNGVCDADESCDGRAGTVACPDDCAGKTTGKPTGRYCYVGDVCEGAGCP